MSDPLRVAQREWVERVLGVRLDADVTAGHGDAAATLHPDDFKRQWQQTFLEWRDAIETVDQQMAALGAACRKTRDPWLVRIADMGLPAVTANHKTPLMAACMDVSTAPPDKLPAAAAKARQAIAAFAKHIAADDQVRGCDANPFGVSVSIRTTLAPVLNSLNDTLRLAAT